MRPILLGFLAAALLASEGAAQQDTHSANFIFPACRNYLYNDPSRALYSAQCAGNIEALAYVSKFLPANLQSCVPEGATLEQTVRVVVAYI